MSLKSAVASQQLPVGSGAFELLREFFKDEVDGLCFQPSVEIHEMKGDLYYKLAVEEILKGGEK